MTLLAALLTAAAVYLVAGAATGRLPRLRGRRRTTVSSRQTWLLQAGVDLTPRQFVAGSVLLGVAAFGLVTAVTATPAVAVVPAIAVALLPRAYFARHRSRRLRTLQEAWPEGIRDLVASISAGMSLNQAIVGLARSGPAPMREAFARYPTLAPVIGVAPALEVVKEELADPTSDRIVEVLVLAHERGGTVLSDILRDLADATVRDVRVLEEIASDGLEQRINARAVFVLPWLVLLALTAQDGFFREFYRTPLGIAVVVVGGMLSLLGMWVVTRLGRQPVEERVLGGAAPRPETAEGAP